MRAHMAALLSVCLIAPAFAAEPVPVIHCSDLYHPHEDPDDHFDLAVMHALPGIELKAVILDDGARQSRAPGSIPVGQLNWLTKRDVPWAVGLGRKLASPEDAGREDRPEYQKGVELILRVLRESPRPVSIVSLGSCRDVAAAFNREPELMRRKVGKLMIFIGEADAAKQDYREYNVGLDPNAYIRILRSGLPVYWVPCFDGGTFKNNGHASYWAANHVDLLGRCAPEVQQYFIYALEKKRAVSEDSIAFLGRPPDPAERERLLAGKRNLWCAAVFEHLAGRTSRVFTFREVEVEVGDDAAIRYASTDRSRKLMRFEVVDREKYGEVMTQATARLLERIRPAKSE